MSNIIITLPSAGNQISIEQISMELQKRLSRIEWGYVEKLRNEPDSPESEIFLDIRDSLIAFCKAIIPDE